MSLILVDLFFLMCVPLLLNMKWNYSWEWSTGHNFIQWIASQPLSLLLNNQFYLLDSCPLYKELSSGQPYPVNKFIQYFEQLGPGPYECADPNKWLHSFNPHWKGIYLLLFSLFNFWHSPPHNSLVYWSYIFNMFIGLWCSNLP